MNPKPESSHRRIKSDMYIECSLPPLAHSGDSGNTPKKTVLLKSPVKKSTLMNQRIPNMDENMNENMYYKEYCAMREKILKEREEVKDIQKHISTLQKQINQFQVDIEKVKNDMNTEMQFITNMELRNVRINGMNFMCRKIL